MRDIFFILLLGLGLMALQSYIFSPPSMAMDKNQSIMPERPEGYPVATLAGGCFWCTESEFRGMEGVLFTRVGYIGGHIDNPKYEDTHDSKSGHAEAVELTYDPDVVTYRELLMHFFTKAHDPTQLNRQGGDVGTQYRSTIFYHDAEQKKIAEDIIRELTDKHEFKKPIVTTLEPATTFWVAEEYHQQYFEKYTEKTGKMHMLEWLHEQKK